MVKESSLMCSTNRSFWKWSKILFEWSLWKNTSKSWRQAKTSWSNIGHWNWKSVNMKKAKLKTAVRKSAIQRTDCIKRIMILKKKKLNGNIATMQCRLDKLEQLTQTLTMVYQSRLQEPLRVRQLWFGTPDRH